MFMQFSCASFFQKMHIPKKWSECDCLGADGLALLPPSQVREAVALPASLDVPVHMAAADRHVRQQVHWKYANIENTRKEKLCWCEGMTDLLKF